jgi:MFS family permease
MTGRTVPRLAVSARALVFPLALAQFVASFAATSMNVAISSIARDLHTTVAGVQTSITLFTLVMAALMIPGSKLSDIWGRKACFVGGLTVYGLGALLAALAPGLVVLIVGYSLLEGVGSALMIPPIYILVTVAFTDIRTRARYFGVVSGAGGLGAAAGPLIGGLITSTLGWRVTFLAQLLLVGSIILLAYRLPHPPRPQSPPRFDLAGAVLSGAGLFFVVLGVLQSRTFGWLASREDFTVFGKVLIPKGSVSPVWLFVAIGVLLLLWFGWHLRRADRAGREPLLRPGLLRNRTANLGLGTQLIQWLTMQGGFFVTSVYLQEGRGYNAIQTGLVMTPATIGVLVSSAAAERLARRHSQRWLVRVGFLLTTAGLVLLPVLVSDTSGVWSFVPGLLLIGLGVGVMLTSSVNIVQSSFPERDQADISGVSRSVSNLGSSLGTALVGSALVAAARPDARPYALSIVVLVASALIGLVLALLIPRDRTAPEQNA